MAVRYLPINWTIVKIKEVSENLCFNEILYLERFCKSALTLLLIVSATCFCKMVFGFVIRVVWQEAKWECFVFYRVRQKPHGALRRHGEDFFYFWRELNMSVNIYSGRELKKLMITKWRGMQFGLASTYLLSTSKSWLHHSITKRSIVTLSEDCGASRTVWGEHQI